MKASSSCLIVSSLNGAVRGESFMVFMSGNLPGAHKISVFPCAGIDGQQHPSLFRLYYTRNWRNVNPIFQISLIIFSYPGQRKLAAVIIVIDIELMIAEFHAVEVFMSIKAVMLRLDNRNCNI